MFKWRILVTLKVKTGLHEQFTEIEKISLITGTSVILQSITFDHQITEELSEPSNEWL